MTSPFPLASDHSTRFVRFTAGEKPLYLRASAITGYGHVHGNSKVAKTWVDCGSSEDSVYEVKESVELVGKLIKEAYHGP